MSFETPAFQANPILFGHAQTPGLLAFELASDTEVRVFRRDPEGGVRAALQPFRPFALLASTELLAGWPGAREVEPLTGQGAYRYLVFFAGWREALDARAHLQRLAPRAEDEAGAPFLFFGDPIQQALTLSGQTHFLELPYAGLRRLQLAVAAFCAEGPAPSAARAEDRLTAIALADSTGWEHVISGRDCSEAEMLAAFERLVQERDPDVIEGHGLFRGDLAYLAARAQRHRVKLRLGRGDGLLRGYPGRLQVAERSIAYRRFEVSGRHLLDTWLMAQQYDVTARDLEGYGLREIASHFRLPGADRLPLTPDRAAWCFQHDPAALLESVREDARETRALGALLGRSYFVQAQIFPFSYQAAALRGNATKIDALLIREYLRRRHAIPAPEPPREVLGGHTEIAYQGVARHVLHYDVTSLYPSVMLAFDCVPARDELRLFAGLLRDLRSFRVEAKRLTRAAPTEEARAHFEALQVTFKILINSFYGYLGFPMGHFNDYAVANQVTAKGRELIQAVIAFLAARGAQLVEADTDGLYVVAPPDVRTPEDEERLLAEVSAILPAGISLEMDGRYRAMFSYKMKNYALLDYEGRLSVTGSGFRSRGLELFQRTWMEEMFRHLLEDRPDRIPEVTRRYAEAFQRHELDVRRFMKTETLQDALPTYREKVRAGKRNPAAAYELALRSGRPYQPGDQVSYYVAGTSKKVKVHEAAKPAAVWDPQHPDENVEYYTAKLFELEAKFRPFFEPRPAGTDAPAAGAVDPPATDASLFPETPAAPAKPRRRRSPSPS